MIAVVGTGSIGMRHLQVLRRLPGVAAVAVPKRPGRFAALEEEGQRAVADLRAAVRMGATRCVIASETGAHVADGVAAAELGLDLLIEKPLAPEPASAIRLLAEARRFGRGLFVGCVLRFSESLATFRELLGEIGRLHTVRVECQSYLPDWRPGRDYRSSYSARAEEGGALRDLIHEIDYAGWIFGWPMAVHARIKNLGRLGIDADEVAELTWETPSGALLSVTLDYLSRPARRGIRAVGEHGTIVWDGTQGMVRLLLRGAPTREFQPRQSHDEMFAAQARAFLASGLLPSDARLATGEEGVSALAVCDAARRASATRREEPVEYLKVLV